MRPDAASRRPERVWRVLRLLAAGLLLAAVVAVILIAVGTFDPKPHGRLLRTDHPGTFEQEGAGERVIAVDAPWPAGSSPERYSVRLSVAQTEGDPDSGYGLVLEGESGRLVVAVSPLGYAIVREEGGGRPTDHVPLSAWPHVVDGENEIWLDIDTADGRAAITAAVNREHLWRGETDWSPDRAGLWLAAFEHRAEVEFRSLEWFAEAADQR